MRKFMIDEDLLRLEYDEDKILGVPRTLVDRLRVKWAKVTRDIDNPYLRDVVMPILLENQLVEVKLYEQNAATTSASMATIPAYVFPLVRRVFPALIANEIVSVQPMTAPVGAVFYLDAVYGTTKGNVTAGSPMFYEAPFDTSYSLSQATDTDSITTNNNFASGTLQYKPVIRRSVSVSGKIIVNNAEVNFSGVDDGSGLISAAGNGWLVRGVINYQTGAIELFASHPFSGNVTVSYRYAVEASGEVSDVLYKIEMKSIVAETRKLRAKWSIETESDLRVYWGKSADETLTQFQSVQLQTEVDRMIVEDLINAAQQNTDINQTWSATPTSGLYPADSPEYIRTLVTKISVVGAGIYKKSFNGSANFIVISPEIQGKLAALPEMAVENPNPVGIARFGVLSNKYTVYVNTYQDREKILVGYIGQTILDAGYIYAPYVPVSFTPALYDPREYTITRGVYHRYGRALVRGYYYGLITVQY